MVAYQLQQDEHGIGTQNAYSASEDIQGPFSLLALGKKEQHITLKPRKPREVVTLKDDTPSMAEDTTNQNPFSHGSPVDVFQHDDSTDAWQRNILQSLTPKDNSSTYPPMRVSPTTNPFNRHEQASVLLCRQPFDSHENVACCQSNEHDSYYVPHTPQATNRSLSRMPPPCRPGEYDQDVLMDSENSPPPCRILFPEF